MNPYCWSTEEEHANNMETMHEYLEDHLDHENFEILEHDGTYAEIKNKKTSRKWGVHARGDGDFRNHVVEFEEILPGSEIDLDNEFLYLSDHFSKEKIRERLQEMKDIGMRYCSDDSFFVPYVMRGMYIERVWNRTDEAFKDYLDWVRELIERKGTEDGS